MYVIHKVISLGGGTLGWVDLWRGILLYNVLDEVPVVQVIQLPMLMPGNKAGLGVCPWNIRDIACGDGLIKLVEVETYERPVDDETAYHDDMLVVYDSDLLAEQPVRDNVGWRIITWYRMTSWNYWRKECMHHDEEISVDHSRHQIGDGGGELLALKNLSASFPVLSLNCHCDDTVYLLRNLKSDTQKIWLVTVDLKMKQLINLAPFSIGGYFSPAYPCQLSKYLKGTLASAGSRS
ncbi:hypothetical protein VPH35_079582 [Triticum aestivum]|uniref:DUF1618 domain-containing protein n=1 Tax=Aegilops tauschii subsp. strangulata TaxID=200361 RepID=A0A453IWN4_AEGTS|nr:uncharacterized protein LOC109753451 isoform X1 [Aegilops tauschii subsp. strangulata]XP_044376633.1 uncharacterized protein LOC123098650 isoform X1 [Triticum aestivum]